MDVGSVVINKYSPETAERVCTIRVWLPTVLMSSPSYGRNWATEKPMTGTENINNYVNKIEYNLDKVLN